MKKILLLTLLFLGTIIHLNAATFEENKKACDAGDAMGCSRLGFMYAKGKGVKQDNFKAKDLFGKACDGGITVGCNNYAILNKK